MKAGLITLGVIVVLFAMCGIYEDRENGDRYLFLKHRPSTHFYFSSPVGESDKVPTDVADIEREALFLEYVEKKGGWARSFFVPL